MWGSDLNSRLCIDRTAESETEARWRPTWVLRPNILFAEELLLVSEFHLFSSVYVLIAHLWLADGLRSCSTIPPWMRGCNGSGGNRFDSTGMCAFVCVWVGSLNVGRDSDECCLCRAEVCKHSRRRTVPVICLVTRVGFGFSKLDTVSPGKPVFTQAPFPFFPPPVAVLPYKSLLHIFYWNKAICYSILLLVHHKMDSYTEHIHSAHV